MIVRKDTEGNSHHPHAWWRFEPGEGPHGISYSGTTMFQLTNSPFYYYAESLNGGNIWEGTDWSVDVDGVRYGLRRAAPIMVSGRLVVQFC